MDTTSLNQVIEPEIKNDAFYELIKQLASQEKLETVLEIGSSAGGGSTDAFVTGLALNPGPPKLFCIEISKARFAVLQQALAKYPFVHCYNRSTVRIDEFPPPRDVIRFYAETDSALRQYPITQVLGWLQQDIDYVRDAGVEAGAIEAIKADHHIDRFDMVLIDGSEFTGMSEFAKIDGAGLILLDDTNTYKCFEVRRHLLGRRDYELIADDQELRGGFSAFRRRPGAASLGVLPIHFFTIVLNGEPFIRYHADMFAKLDVPWHWHVVEGVASLAHDTAWSVEAGGSIPESAHDHGRSNDGTSQFLDDLAARHPDNVTIYRKPPGTFWDGKREMVAAPLPNIREECLLWQVDADELWTAEQIGTVHRMFSTAPERSAAMYWCWYFVGPEKIISTRYNYAQNPMQEWLRTWRYRPGDQWLAHEPPILVRSDAAGTTTDVAKIAPFGHDEMERAGVTFQHYAYAIEAQLLFKESYYGYKDARAQWTRLQAHKGSALLRDYFDWVSDATMFDGVEHFPVVPIAKQDAKTGHWQFTDADAPPAKPCAGILLDGIIWQYGPSTIGRVWIDVLKRWVETGFSDNVMVLDRAGTAPRIDGLHYWTIARHDDSEAGRDSLELERVCRQLGADLFVSTFYSTPTTTPSVFVGYDMIPEKLGFDAGGTERADEKRRAICHAGTHIMSSPGAAKELEAAYPDVGVGRTRVAQFAASPRFFKPKEEEVERFRAVQKLSTKPYVVLLGDRLGHTDYRNSEIAFVAIEQLQSDMPTTLLCIAGADQVEPRLALLAPTTEVRCLDLNGDELRVALGGAHALLYLSGVEGFDTAPLEAMACGCPVIVSGRAPVAELVGDGGLHADADEPHSVTDHLRALRDPESRHRIVEAGLACTKAFSFTTFADTIEKALVESRERIPASDTAKVGLAWTEMREMQLLRDDLVREGKEKNSAETPVQTEGLEDGDAGSRVPRVGRLISMMRTLLKGSRPS